jgi:uncharacterized RDD family membrane protein YckC
MLPDTNSDQSSTDAISSGAGFWIRAGARVIDTVYGTFLGFVAGVFGGIALVMLQHSGLIAPGWEGRIKGFNLVGLGLGLLGNLLYHSLTEGMFGASLGKLICQLRVVTEEGRPITLGKAFVRSLAYFVDALFFGLVAYSSMSQSDLNQRYGDKWAHTVVVHSKDAPAGSKKGAEIFVLALLMGSACWTVLAALGLVLHAR